MPGNYQGNHQQALAIVLATGQLGLMPGSYLGDTIGTELVNPA
jgi:hypothetical protein